MDPVLAIHCQARGHPPALISMAAHARSRVSSCKRGWRRISRTPRSGQSIWPTTVPSIVRRSMIPRLVHCSPQASICGLKPSPSCVPSCHTSLHWLTTPRPTCNRFQRDHRGQRRKERHSITSTVRKQDNNARMRMPAAAQHRARLMRVPSAVVFCRCVCVGAAAAVLVQVDVLTGELAVLNADLIYDAGISLNPAIDIGQIEGGQRGTARQRTHGSSLLHAQSIISRVSCVCCVVCAGFIQGLGYNTCEEITYDSQGNMTAINTW